MNPERLKKFDKEKLIEFILRKDEEIEHLKERVKNLNYMGRLFMEGNYWSFYIKREEEAK